MKTTKKQNERVRQLKSDIKGHVGAIVYHRRQIADLDARIKRADMTALSVRSMIGRGGDRDSERDAITMTLGLISIARLRAIEARDGHKDSMKEVDQHLKRAQQSLAKALKG